MDNASFVAVKAALGTSWCEEVVDGCGSISACGVETWSLLDEFGGSCLRGGEWCGDEEGVAIGFDEVAAFDVGLKVEGVDDCLDWSGFCAAW